MRVISVTARIMISGPTAMTWSMCSWRSTRAARASVTLPCTP